MEKHIHGMSYVVDDLDDSLQRDKQVIKSIYCHFRQSLSL